MSGEVELIFLERRGDRWQFKTKPHGRFDKMWGAMSYINAFNTKIVRFTPGSGYMHIKQCYEVSEEGMWFLRPHFANWDEMLKNGNPKHTEEEVCAKCGVDGFDDLNECDTCHQIFCSGCFSEHRYNELKQESNYNYKYTWEFVNGGGNDEIHNFFRNFGGSYSFRYGQRREYTSGYVPPNPSVSKSVREAFSLLGLEHTANADQIKKAFRSKAKVMHPDTGGNVNDMAKLSNAKDVALQHAERQF